MLVGRISDDFLDLSDLVELVRDDHSSCGPIDVVLTRRQRFVHERRYVVSQAVKNREVGHPTGGP